MVEIGVYDVLGGFLWVVGYEIKKYFSSFWRKWVHSQYSLRYKMFRRFVGGQFSGKLFYRKMAAWVNGEAEESFIWYVW